MMKTMKHIPWMLLAVLAFATACTQDELTDNPSATSQTLEIASHVADAGNSFGNHRPCRRR